MSDSPSDSVEKPTEAPKSFLAKLGAAIPVALTALATVLAGMSTGALSQSMFWRSAAAQDQSKATNQWSLAGFKRDRSLMMQLASANLMSQSGYAKLPTWPTPKIPEKATPAEIEQLTKTNAQALEWLGGKGPPRVEPPKISDDNLSDLLKAIREREPEADILRKAALVKQDTINKAIDDAEKFTEKTDSEWSPAVRAAGQLADLPPKAAPNSAEYADQVKGATAAKASFFELENRRYRTESALNQGIGYLYDARVKVSTAESDRHGKRSRNFFTAMLLAQIGSVVASLGMNKKKGSLSAVALLMGLAAIGFGAYVFLAI